MADKFLRIKLGSTRLDLPAPAEDLRTAAGEDDLNEINLTDVHYQALNEQGDALSPYESIAAAKPRRKSWPPSPRSAWTVRPSGTPSCGSSPI